MYAVIVVSCLAGVLVNLLPTPPFRLLCDAAVLNGIISPPLRFILVPTAGDRGVMGSFANGWLSNTMGWGLFACMTRALVLLVIP